MSSLSISSAAEALSDNKVPVLKSILFGAFVYLLFWIIYSRFFHPLKDIPGPFWASVSRYWLPYQVSTGEAERILRALHEELGPLVRTGPDEVSVADPHSVQLIYGIKSDFTKSDFYVPWGPKISSHGDHFSQQNEAKHASFKRLVSNVYSMSSILKSEEYIDACADVFMAKMAALADTKKVVDLGEWIHWYTFDVIGELFYGRQFGFMRDEKDFGGYILTIDTLMPVFAVICLLPTFLRPLLPLSALLVPNIGRAFQGFNDLRQSAKFWVSHRMQQMVDKKVSRSDLLDKLFQVRQNKADFDIPEIEGESFIAIFAGSDTTAIAIRAILYYLMKTPETYRKLMEEIDEADRDGRLSRPHIKYSEAIQLPYLMACCKEAMRMHPSVGLCMPRVVPAGGRVVAGQFIPAGSIVGISPAVLHRNKDMFGQDADVYNPNRWLGDPAVVSEMDRHMLHFGAGSRTCIGKNISLAEIHKMVPQMLREYTFELADPCKKWKIRNFWFHTQSGINAYVSARERR